MNYSGLTKITVNTQEELNRIPTGFEGRICVKFGTNSAPALYDSL